MAHTFPVYTSPPSSPNRRNTRCLPWSPLPSKAGLSPAETRQLRLAYLQSIYPIIERFRKPFLHVPFFSFIRSPFDFSKQAVRLKCGRPFHAATFVDGSPPPFVPINLLQNPTPQSTCILALPFLTSRSLPGPRNSSKILLASPTP